MVPIRLEPLLVARFATKSWETRRPNFMSTRMIAMREAMKQGGRDLILVRYSAEQQRVRLINYYRKILLYQPDIDPTTLVPYGSVSQ